MKNQCQKMLTYMETHGSITGMESINIGIINYRGRINDLRKLGFDIETKMETSVNSEGEKKTFARYYLAPAEGFCNYGRIVK